MAEVAHLESVGRSPEIRKMISKLTSDTKATVLEIARKDKNRNKNKKKMIEGSAEGSVSTTELPVHASGDIKTPFLDTQSTIDDNGTIGDLGVNFNYTVSAEVVSAPDYGIVSNPLSYDTSHYCSLFSSTLRSRVEERILHIDSSNPATELSVLKLTSSTSYFVEQSASDEKLKSALASLIEMLTQI